MTAVASRLYISERNCSTGLQVAIWHPRYRGESTSALDAPLPWKYAKVTGSGWSVYDQASGLPGHGVLRGVTLADVLVLLPDHRALVLEVHGRVLASALEVQTRWTERVLRLRRELAGVS